MRRSQSSVLVRALPFAAATLFAVPALARARDVVDEYAANIFNYLGDIRPLHLFAAACVFLVIGIFAKAREASTFMIFGSFFMTAVCVAAFIIFALTGDLMDKRHARPRPTPSETTAEAAKTAAPEKKAKVRGEVNASAQIGDKCRRDADCNASSVCAKVAGSRNCWAPCGTGGQCDSGFACMSDTSKEMVCVR